MDSLGNPETMTRLLDVRSPCSSLDTLHGERAENREGGVSKAGTQRKEHSTVIHKSVRVQRTRRVTLPYNIVPRVEETVFFFIVLVIAVRFQMFPWETATGVAGVCTLSRDRLSAHIQCEVRSQCPNNGHHTVPIRVTSVLANGTTNETQ